MMTWFMFRRSLGLVTLIADALIAYFCGGLSQCEKKSFEQQAAEIAGFTSVAEYQSAVANSIKKSGVPQPGSVPGTGQAAVAAPATGANAKAELVVTNGGNTSLVGVDSNGNQKSSVPVPNGFNNVSASPDGTVVAGTSGSTLTALNPATGATTATANLANGTPAAAKDRPRAITPTPVPAGTAVMPDNSGAYVTDKSTGTYYFVNFKDSSVIAYTNAVTPPGSGKPAILPNGSQLWIPNPAANSITVYDTFTNTLVFTIKGISAPSEIAFTPDGTRAAVVSKPSTTSAGAVAAVDTTLYMVLGQVQVGINPNGISGNPYGTDFWLANTGSGTISDVQISGVTPTLVETDPVGTSPAGVAVVNTYVR